MNDANQALLIGLIATFVTGVLIPLITHFLKTREIKLLAAKIDATKEDVHKVELATNSMKDQLVAATKIASHAEGYTQSEADQKAREAEQAKGTLAQVEKQKDLDKIPKGSITP
jgi:hypothetical protein